MVPGELAEPFAEPGKRGHCPIDGVPLRPGVRLQHEILTGRQIREDAAALGYVAQTLGAQGVRGLAE
jgi:hypothetical protein